MWLTAYGRNFYNSVIANCVSNGYAASFDGINDFAINNGTILQTTGVLQKQWVSLWIKDLDTAAKNGGETMFSQGFGGNSSSNAWYLAYNTRASNGTDLNAITFQWQSNGTGNRVVKRWNLFGANTPITGSTSITDFWLSTNGNINTNPNGFVHILLIMDVPAVGQAMTTGNYDLYWNGQLLTQNTTPNIENGVAFAQGGTPDFTIGYNTPFVTGFTNARIDELFATNSSNSSLFMTEYSLTTDQDVASFLYNGGCPGDIGSDGRWNGLWWRFENNWNADSGTNPFNPINGATFSTDHA